IQPVSYSLTVTGAGNGTVSDNAGLLTWSGNAGSGSYLGGQQVTLTATPAAGSMFTGWGGACSGTGACVVMISSQVANAVTATFISTAPTTYSISGTVGSLSGVAMALTGSASSATVKSIGTAIKAQSSTTSNGAYTFTSLPAGSYTITPSKAGYTFSPASLVVSINSSNVTNQNFTATQPFTVTATAGSNGSVSPSTQTV